MAVIAPSVEPGQLRAIRLWCRRRSDVKVARCRDIQPYRLRGVPHEEIRYQLGLTVDEYRRARSWLDEAAERCVGRPDHLGVDEMLRQLGDEHIERVMKYGLLRQQGATFPQIRDHLGLTERELDIVAAWWRDAHAAVSDRRGFDRD